MKISFFFSDLRGGGVERVRILLAHEFLKLGYEVDFVLLNKRGVLLSSAPKSVRIRSLDCSRMRNSFLPLSRYLKSENPDVLIASMWPLTSIAVLSKWVARFKGRVILSEHVTISLSKQYVGFRKYLIRASFRYVNYFADNLVGVSEGVCSDLLMLGANKNKLITIHNPAEISTPKLLDCQWKDHLWFKASKDERLLAVGRLSKEKGFDVLIDAFFIVKQKKINAKLLILGEGSERPHLQLKIDQLGLCEDVILAGFVTDPGSFYKEAGLFVLSSFVEGFGNVIVEALLSGVPVVATDCQSGPSEILLNGEFGNLVDVGDVNQLALKILVSLEEPIDPDRLRRRGLDFSPSMVAGKYIDLFHF